MQIVEDQLPMDPASRLQRAKDLGFIIRAYHGTGAIFNAFDLNKGRATTTMGYAPHFSDRKAEAVGYAKNRAMKGRGRTLEVLLRVKNPFILDMNTSPRVISADEYTRLVGRAFEPSHYCPKPTSYRTFSDMQSATEKQQGMGYGGDDTNDRRRWTEIYRRLMDAGYDAILWPNTPADHSRSPYGKYIVFEPKNIRLAKAAFDPAKSDSTDLMA